MINNSRFMRFPVLAVLVLGGFLAQAEEAPARHEDETANTLSMSAQERVAKGVVTSKVGLHAFSEELTVPGEVVANAYASSQITTRIAAQVIQRHVKMGDSVQAGMKLLTLSSVEMAAAQGELVVAHMEWQRLQKLGRDVVTESRFIGTQVASQQAYAKVLAYGMTAAQADTLLEQGHTKLATGEFDLLALQSGTIVSDPFVLGEFVEPGRILMEISDESALWVEAKLSPTMAGTVTTGSLAKVQTGDGVWMEGTVIQHYHRLDETTRTQAVRIAVANRDDRLHPGQFVTVAILSDAGESHLAVPTGAIVLMQGGNIVFKLAGEEIQPQAIETGSTSGDWTEVKAGLASGDEIVIQGAFLFKSLLLKSQIGDSD